MPSTLSLHAFAPHVRSFYSLVAPDISIQVSVCDNDDLVHIAQRNSWVGPVQHVCGSSHKDLQMSPMLLVYTLYVSVTCPEALMWLFAIVFYQMWGRFNTTSA